MSQWYLSKNGQALGPLEEDKVIALIEEGDLSPIDLVYQTGATEWVPISEVEIFAQHFQKAEDEAAPQGDGEREWVILKKVVTDKGKEYKQLGPFAVSQVFKMIDQGEAKFTDFAWKQGMETWVKISEIQDFAMPLPSTPPVDTAIYEKTKTNVAIGVSPDTVVDKDQKASLTELVNIEHYQHEKTMVQPSAQPQQTESDRQEESMDDERTSDLGTDEDALYAEISEVTPIPINEESFVTDSEISAEGDESNVSLWSLQPPGTKSKVSAEAASEKTQVKDAQDLSPQKGKKKKKPKPKPQGQGKAKKKGKASASKEDFRLPLSDLSTESWQWIGVISAVVLAFIFFYQSFKVDRDPIQYDETSQYNDNSGLEEAPVGQPFQDNEIDEKMANYQQALKKARDVAAQDKPQSVSEGASQPPSTAVPPPPGPKVPIAEKTEPNPKTLPTPEPEKNVATGKKPEPPKAPVKELPPQLKVPERSVAGKKNVIKTRAKIMEKTKKKVAAPATKPTRQVSNRKAPAAVSVATGGQKSQSFYKQRDRMALFYSSLKAETLAVEIANQFRKLKGSQSAWSRYYGQWKKKVRASLAKDIREFPKRKEMYAYPKVLAKFKDDYNLFYKYGESFDAKVKGHRSPSGVPDNMRAIFTRYKKQAKSLGR